jgi:chitinase
MRTCRYVIAVAPALIAISTVACGATDSGGGHHADAEPTDGGDDGSAIREGGEYDENAVASGEAAAPGAATSVLDSGDAAGADGGAPTGLWVMGYYSSWDTNSYPVAQIDWSGLTHIATAFNLPDGNGGVAALGSIDPELARSVVSAAHAAGKKALASIGGSGSATVFEGSTAQVNLASFVDNLKTLVTTLGYDGLDLDWEGGPASDQALTLALVQALRAAMPSVLITMPVGVENNNLPDDLSIYGTLAPLLDQINIMSYGMSGAWQGWKSWHSSPLHWNKDSSTPVGIDNTVAAYLAANVPPSKLGVGSGFFGECYSSPVTAPDQPLAGAQVVAGDGVMSYAHIMSAYYSASAHQWDSTASVPYLSFSASQSPEGCTYVTYEDAESIAAKAAWVKSNGLGGIIIWTINEGYLASAPSGQQSPLLDAMRTGFLQ